MSPLGNEVVSICQAIARNHPQMILDRNERNLEKRMDRFAEQLIANAPTADDLQQLEVLVGRLQAIGQDAQAHSSSDFSLIAKVHAVTYRLREALANDNRCVAFVVRGQLEEALQRRALVAADNAIFYEQLSNDALDLILLEVSVDDLGRIAKINRRHNQRAAAVLLHIAQTIAEKLQDPVDPLLRPLKQFIDRANENKKTVSTDAIRAIFAGLFSSGLFSKEMPIHDIAPTIMQLAAFTSHHPDRASLYFELIKIIYSKGIQKADIESFNHTLEVASSTCRLSLEAYLEKLKAIKEGVLHFSQAGKALQSDVMAVKIAVARNGMDLQWASTDCKNEEEIVWMAIYQNYLAFEYASDRLKGHFTFVKRALANDPLVFRLASDACKSDPEIVKLAVAQNGYLLQYASEVCRNDPEVVKIAVKESGNALAYASESCTDNEEIVMLAITCQSKRFVIFAGQEIRHASERLRNKRDLVKQAVSMSALALNYVNPRFWQDREIVRLAVSKDGMLIASASDKIKRDRASVKLAVASKGEALLHAPAFQDDQEIVGLAVRRNGLALKHASARLKNNREIVTWAVTNAPSAFIDASQALKDDAAIAELAVSQNGELLAFASERLRANRWIVSMAIRQNSRAREWVSPALRGDSILLSSTGSYDRFEELRR